MASKATRAFPARSDSVTTLMSAKVFNATVTTFSSASVDCSRFKRFLLHLDLLSTSNPTTIQFKVQFSRDAGVTWSDYKKDEFASLYYEDTDLATEQYECFAGEVAGRLFRITAIAVGTDAGKLFTVTCAVEFYA